jgi:HSP20 family protein
MRVNVSRAANGQPTNQSAAVPTQNLENVWREFFGVADAINRLREGDVRPYDYVRSGGSGEQSSERVVRLPIDAWSSDDAFTLTAYLPGVDIEQVEVLFENDELAIRGSFAPVQDGVDFIKRELFHGAFERRVAFNVPVDADRIEAGFEHGVLTLRVPKAESVKPKQIKVVAK